MPFVPIELSTCTVRVGQCKSIGQCYYKFVIMIRTNRLFRLPEKLIGKKLTQNMSIKIFDMDGMPTPIGVPFFGTTLALIAAGSGPKLHMYVDKRHQQLGPIYKEKIGPINCIFVSDPYDMRSIFSQEGKYPIHILPEAWTLYNKIYGCSRGLFFMDGPEWWHYRKILNKLLLKGDLEWMEASSDFVIDKYVKELEENNSKCITLPNLESSLYKLSLEVLISLLLGVNRYSETFVGFQTEIEYLASTLHLVFLTTSKLSLIPANLAYKLRIPRWRKFVKSVDDALFSTNKIVEGLLENCPDKEGLLGKLIEENVSKEFIKKIVTDLILAAGDTTAYSMQWIFYLISKNQDVQEKLRKQLETDQAPRHLRNVLKESLRLYPVAPFLTRILPQNATIGGYKVPSGTPIVMSIYTSGRNGQYFEKPDKFIPERWDRRSEISSLAQAASIPFAIGARACVGRKIAEYELQQTLARIIRKFDIELCNETEIEPVLKMVAVPSEPIKLIFKNRSISN